MLIVAAVTSFFVQIATYGHLQEAGFVLPHDPINHTSCSIDRHFDQDWKADLDSHFLESNASCGVVVFVLITVLRIRSANSSSASVLTRPLKERQDSTSLSTSNNTTMTAP